MSLVCRYLTGFNLNFSVFQANHTNLNANQLKQIFALAISVCITINLAMLNLTIEVLYYVDGMKQN